MNSQESIRLNEKDNVLVLPFGGSKGAIIAGTLTLATDIPAGHKAAARKIADGESVIKYGHVIGIAKETIAPGMWVHEHNVRTQLGTAHEEMPVHGASGTFCETHLPTAEAGTFMGYRRDAGRPGVRNDIWVIPTVGCINGELRAALRDYAKPAWIDEVRLLEHPYGCSQLGGDIENTRDALAGLAHNPNAAGVLVVGLGCENLSADELTAKIDGGARVKQIILQEADVSDIPNLLDALAENAPRAREPFPLSTLCVGVKCGGSDGYSGLTANPLVGRFSDSLTACGGTILATEIPEMFGAESEIAARICSPEVFDRFLALDRWFRDFFVRYDQPIYENPSPGNRAGGITTLEEKSLGAVEKTGHAPVTRVLDYGAQIGPEGGVQITFAPGNDLVSSTALAASGAQIILFTTGRGTPFGTVVPTVKISTNTPLFEKHPNWIDFDAGALHCGASWESERERLMKYVTDVASGEKTAHERKGFGEIAIFKDGVTL